MTSEDEWLKFNLYKNYLKKMTLKLWKLSSRSLGSTHESNGLKNGTHWLYSADVDIIPRDGMADMLQQF